MSATRGREVGKLIDVIVDKAAALRRAGVLEVEIDGLSFGLLPLAVGSEGAAEDVQAKPEPPNPFDDPASYPGGIVPGYGTPDGYDDA